MVKKERERKKEREILCEHFHERHASHKALQLRNNNLTLLSYLQLNLDDKQNI
jgi:hypothetical protein